MDHGTDVSMMVVAKIPVGSFIASNATRPWRPFFAGWKPTVDLINSLQSQGIR